MQTHETLSGLTIKYETPTGATAAFFERVRAAVLDPAVTEDAMTALVYGQENPLLDRTVFAEHAAVTPAVFAEPLYHVLLDLIGRKRHALGRLDLVATEARYTLTPDEAAERLGVHVSAIRQAIERHRLPAWKRGGRLWLDPVSCDAYKLATRGRAS